MIVLIKGMEMPKNCGECHFCHTENFTQWCCPTGREDVFYDSIPKWCPLSQPKTGKCKDCTHWDKLDYEAPRQGWCYQFEEFTDADEYCSRCAMMRGDSDG